MTLLASKSSTRRPWLNDGKRAIPQAFPYQGSKRAIASNILSAFPPDDVVRLIEPFAGSAAISVAARKYGLASEIVLADVNEPLINLWRAILLDSETLISRYRELWHKQVDNPKSFYTQVRSEFNSSGMPHHFLYLLCRCVKAAVRYNQKTGEFNQGPDNRRLGARPDVVAARVSEVSELLRGASAYVSDYAHFLLTAKPEDLVYMDPPYQGTCDVADHRYLQGLSSSEFAKTLAEANLRDISYIISYDGATGDKTHGTTLPKHLNLLKLKIEAGRSSQATLLGREEFTVESLYLSPALVERLGGVDEAVIRVQGRNFDEESTLF
jgi:DNA adenine methylase